MDLKQLEVAITDYYPDPDLELVRKAYSFAKEQHQHQVRASGEPYFIHIF